MDKNQVADEMDNKVLKYVHQFLIEHNFENTADAFMIEANIKGLPNFEKDVKTEDDIYKNYNEQMMLSYNAGDWRTFFQLWNLLIPEEAKQTKAYKILMLYLHVYFAVLPKRAMISHFHKQKDDTQTQDSNSTAPSNQPDSEFDENFMTEVEKNMCESMEQLREFLNTTGKELKNDTELRPYFALPYIEEPYAESFLSKIFEKDWTDQLTESLQIFLSNCKAQSFSFSKCTNLNVEKPASEYSSVSKAETKEDAIAKKPLKGYNIPIIPNDRNIPIFLEEDASETLCNVSENVKPNQRSRSVQTVSNSSEKELYSSDFIKKDKRLLQAGQQLVVTSPHFWNVQSSYEKLKARFHKLHGDYHKLMSIARVLTTALENSAKGQVIDFQAMLETCIKIFPDLFNQNIRTNSRDSSELLLNKYQSDLRLINSATYNSNVPPKLLNFKKIKMHLINGSIKTKLFLLQALRRKITLSQLGERDDVVHEYVSKDLLGLHSKIASYKGKSILPCLLTPQNIIILHPVQQSIARLLNALASFRCGRDYLSFDSSVVDMVVQCLTTTNDNNMDTLTYNMMIATLQKLSLRKQQRIYMIESGLVEWLIRHLYDQYHVMDSYRLEYATALLMNLSLHHTCRSRAAGMASLLVSTLTELLLMDHLSTFQYVKSALNNFLMNHTINQEAKKMKFAVVLEQYSKFKSDDMRKSLEYILKIHKGEVVIDMEDEEVMDNDNEEYDELESQLEENDPVKNNYGELSGESLLRTCYTISPKTVQDSETDLNVSTQQYEVNETKTPLEEKQIKSLYTARDKHASGKSLSKKYDVRSKDNSLVFQEYKNSTPNEYFPRKSIGQKRSIKSRDSSTILQDSVKRTIMQPKPRVNDTKLNLTTMKDRPIYRQQSTNDKRTVNNDIKLIDRDYYDDSAMFIYENQTSKESSFTTVASSMHLAVESEAESTVMQKLSSIESL